MLQTPKYGWSKITIGDWEDRCSYLDDVPYRLLEAVDYTNRTHRTSSVKFDAEGYEYIIVFDMYETHIISNDINGKWQYRTINICLPGIISDLLDDIREDLDEWSAWGYDMSEDEIEERHKDLSAWCNVIERRL